MLRTNFNATTLIMGESKDHWMLVLYSSTSAPFHPILNLSVESDKGSASTAARAEGENMPKIIAKILLNCMCTQPHQSNHQFGNHTCKVQQKSGSVVNPGRWDPLSMEYQLFH
jgi:hypothetical protein